MVIATAWKAVTRKGLVGSSPTSSARLDFERRPVLNPDYYGLFWEVLTEYECYLPLLKVLQILEGLFACK